MELTDRYDSGLGPHADHVALVCTMGTGPDEVVARGSELHVRTFVRQRALKIEREDGNVHTRGLGPLAVFLTDVYIERPDGSHMGVTTDCCAGHYVWKETDW